ncbi:MAG: polysaccharide deacetylase family protein [Bacillota bacterium]|jgi:polysaccharide deacetylase family sporulation protein PdaB
MIVLRIKKKTLRLGGFLLLCAVAFAAAGRVPTALPAATTGLKPVYSVERSDRAIALSFDASWGAEHTEELLAALAENDVRTTFFLVNLWIDEYPDLVRKIDAAGHEIGLHSATHPHFTELSPAEMTAEIEKNRGAVKALTGREATLFRPPFGDYNDDVITAVEAAGLTAVQWSVDSLDWQGLSAAEISRRVLDGAAPGAIVLLHNNGDHTAEALKTILPALKEEGYRIVPVSELLLSGESAVGQDGVMRPVK